MPKNLECTINIKVSEIEPIKECLEALKEASETGAIRYPYNERCENALRKLAESVDDESS